MTSKKKEKKLLRRKLAAPYVMTLGLKGLTVVETAFESIITYCNDNRACIVECCTSVFSYFIAFTSHRNIG